MEEEKCDVTIMKEGMNVSMKTVERIEPGQRKGAALKNPVHNDLTVVG